MKRDLIYIAEGTEQRVHLRRSVIEHVQQYRQTDDSDPESGGQLFAEINARDIIVIKATGPYKVDRASRFRLTLNQRRQKDDILRLFQAGLHFVGEWHTHPEPRPSPSCLDLSNISDCFAKSRHQLSSFLMLIVGTDLSESGLWISQHDDSRYRRLRRDLATAFDLETKTTSDTLPGPLA